MVTFIFHVIEQVLCALFYFVLFSYTRLGPNRDWYDHTNIINIVKVAIQVSVELIASLLVFYYLYRNSVRFGASLSNSWKITVLLLEKYFTIFSLFICSIVSLTFMWERVAV